MTIQSEVLTKLQARTAFHVLISCDVSPCQMAQSLPLHSSWQPRGQRAHRFLSQHLMQHFALNPTALDEDCADPVVRSVLLLPAANLLRFARHLGVILAAGEVRHVISRAEVQAYRAALGAELYDFQMERALLLGAHGLPMQQFGAEQIMNAIELSGLRGLQALIEQTRPDLWSRLRLKLPVVWDNLPDLPVQLPPYSTLFSLVRRLFRELEAQ
ncbi:MAG: SctK family type III secretion system sorting platform protein [Pseudomonadota bacterium]